MAEDGGFDTKDNTTNFFLISMKNYLTNVQPHSLAHLAQIYVKFVLLIYNLTHVFLLV